MDVARQVQEIVDGIGHFMQISPVTGIVGSDSRVDTFTGYDGQQIVIGEPNQVHDMIRSGTITMDKINLLALM